MGYTTDFTGRFDLDRNLLDTHAAYLRKFSDTRRMKRNPEVLDNIEDPIRENVGLPIGAEGEYFVGGDGFMGQDRDDSIVDYNREASTQPSLWCQWVPTDDNLGIEWDQGEKFYEYVAWLEYIINNFLAPWGYVLNGEVEWQGEEHDDIGKIIVENNKVSTKLGYIEYR